MKRRSSGPYWINPFSHGYAVANAIKAGRQPPGRIPAPAESEHLASALAYHRVLESPAGPTWAQLPNTGTPMTQGCNQKPSTK